MNVPFPANPSDGDTWTAAKVAAIVAAVTGYTIPVTDLANQYATFVFPINTDSLGTGATFTARAVVPASQTWVAVAQEVSYQTATAGTPTVTLQVTDDGANLFSASASAASAGGTPTAVTDVVGTGVAPGSLLVFTLTNTSGVGNTAGNVTGVVHFKVKHLA